MSIKILSEDHGSFYMLLAQFVEVSQIGFFAFDFLDNKQRIFNIENDESFICSEVNFEYHQAKYFMRRI